MNGIYVHVPFCDSKCHYCAFASFVADDETKKRYFESLKSEITERQNKSLKISSVYFGGGTPSSVSVDFIAEVLEKIRECFSVEEKAELSIECNPCSATEEKLVSYKNLGFNRISFGIQSLSSKALRLVGRRHSPKDAKRAVRLAKRAGFKNISADLLLGVPHAAPARDAQKLARLGVKHLSAYMLQLESGTKLKKMVEENKICLINEEKCVKTYEKVAKTLKRLGFERYEISNFAKPGFESVHNGGYWTGMKYLGFGLGAHSFDGNQRRANGLTNEDYFARKLSLQETLSRQEKDAEMIMLGLRCKWGFDKTKLSFDISKKPNFQNLLKQNILQQHGQIVTLSPKYYSVSNSVILQLLN